MTASDDVTMERLVGNGGGARWRREAAASACACEGGSATPAWNESPAWNVRLASTAAAKPGYDSADGGRWRRPVLHMGNDVGDQLLHARVAARGLGCLTRNGGDVLLGDELRGCGRRHISGASRGLHVVKKFSKGKTIRG